MRARSGRRVKYADLGDGACWGGRDAYAQEGLDRLTDPELVDEHGPEGIELVVADAYGNQDQGARVVEGHPGGLADDLVVDARPEVRGGVGISGFERESQRCLGVDPAVAERAVVDVGRIIGEERAAGEERVDEV